MQIGLIQANNTDTKTHQKTRIFGRLCAFLVILFISNSCSNDMETIMLQQKWKLVETYSIMEGSVWLTGLDTLDLTGLPTTKTEDGSFYFKEIDGKSFIILNKGYFEITELAQNKLLMEMTTNHAETKEPTRVALLEFEPLKK